MSSVSSLERIFFECLQRDTPEARAACLEEACAGDAESLRRLRKMLEAQGSDFLERAAHVPGASLEAPLDADRPGLRIGPYRLVELIGQGGMGAVWHAEQVEPVQRQVALKLIKAGMDSRQVIARFEAERQALARMDHPNIARVLDAGADAAGRPYFVMDLFEGLPITRYCDERRLPVRQRLELFAQVCEAIQHAHQKGVIHRDVKPSNVLVALQDGRPVPKVIDFGIAKAVEPSFTERTALTQPGGLVGTLEYMSPEQSASSSADVDTRSDIYSLGVLLYELLTGGTPLSPRLREQLALPQLLRVIADEETPKPSTRLAEAGAATAAIAARRGVERSRLANLVRGELDWIVLKALEKDRNRRYATAVDLAMDVRRFLAHEPVLAGPPSTAYRLRKFARRHRGALAAASVLVAALLVAIGGVGWAVRDRAARKVEEERVAADRGARVLATVQGLLAEAELQMAAQSWPEALATVRRADAAATSGEADPATTRRVRALLEDLEFVDRLDRVRSRQAMFLGKRFDSAAAVREYAQAFHDHGLDLESASDAAVIERLRTTPALALPLAAGLDSLAKNQLLADKDLAACRRWLRLADAVDPDPVRGSIRSNWTKWDATSDAELLRLADSIDLRKQPPATLVHLAWALGGKQRATADRLLRDAQREHPADFWLAFELAVALDAEGDRDGALRFYTAAVAIRPESAAARNNLAYVLLNRGETEAALAVLQRAIDLDPSVAMLHVNMGKVYVDQRKPHEAVASLRHALELDPGCAVAWIGLGTVMLDMLHRLDEAGDAFQHAIELAPDDAHAIAGASSVLRGRGQFQEAAATARQAIAADPDCAGGYVALGNALGDAGDFAASAESFRKAIELEPKNEVALSNLGGALGASNDPSKREESLALCRKAVELAPDYALGHLGLGNALSNLGQAEAALVPYRKAIELDPTLVAAYFNLGQASWSLERMDDAMAAYRKAVELRPNHVECWLMIARVHLARNEWVDAEAALRKVVELHPADANAYHSLSVVLRRLGRGEESLSARRRAAEIEPRVAMRRVAVATDLYEMERYDEAVAVCREAIEVDPRCGTAHAMLGAVLRLQGKYEEAIEPLGRAVQLDPENASLTGVLAMLLVTCPDPKANDGPRALELARKALELEPGKAAHSRTLGVALYRTGHWQEALDALDVASQRDPDATGFDSFFGAMAHQQLGDAVAARAAYEQGSVKFERSRSADQDTRRVRDEAAQLLGIELQPR